MKRISIIVLAFGLLFGSSLFAQKTSDTAPLWMRYCSISPDGNTIAFAFKGDIFTVPVAGGVARQITTNPAFDSRPIWSPNGENIAFVSERMGSLDIYVVHRNGGTPIRLTTFSGNEQPIAFKNDSTVLFSANVMPSAESSQFPSSSFSQVYQVSIKGGRPMMFSTLPMEYITFNSDGKTLLYNDMKGYEDPWRKHHTSSITRDIWSCELSAEGTPANGKFTKLTSFAGEDRNPVFAGSEGFFYYLSEQNGSFNVYYHKIGSKDAPKQITKFEKNPVRFLSVASNGTLCFGYDGEIYTSDSKGNVKKVEIEIVTDQLEKDVVKKVIKGGATEIAVSKDGEQIAFIYHGDVYVTSSEYKTTKQITNTAEQERDLSFSPDGRSIVYSSERNGLWQIYLTKIQNDSEKFFPYSTALKEERLTNSNSVSFQPLFSPNGKEVAFLENRSAIRVINLESKGVRTVMDEKFEYSYGDGDQWYQWSPDSKWILSNCIFIGGWNNKDVALIDASGNGVMYNLTKSGYNDGNAKWVLDGKAMIWASDRAGYRSHGSWGSESDIYIMFFDLEAYDRFRMNKEDLALLEEAEKVQKEKKEQDKKEVEKKKGDKEKKKGDKEEEIKPLIFDLDNAEYRVVRLTPNSSKLGDAVLSLKGDKLFYLTSFESGMDLWVHDLKENSTKILSKGIGGGSLVLSNDGKYLFLNNRMGISKIDVENGKITNVPFESTFDYKPYGERVYIFDHSWRQVADKFYDPAIHGIDWSGYKETYHKFLPFISNNYDFAEMLGEMLGELNGSHTGARYFGGGDALPTACLGVFYDDQYEGDGLKIKEIIKRSPITLSKNEIKEGCVIEKIDGQTIVAGQDYFPLLEGKVGNKVILSVLDPTTKKHFDVTIKAISYGEQNALLYKRWVERCRDMVDQFSGGKIAYVHIQGMNSQSFRELYSELLGRMRDKDAVVVDTRHNGGGWLHDDVVTLLSGKEYQRFMPRGRYIGSDPYNKWLKPSCMLICEDNYSNAHGTPWVYKTLNVGKLVGAPVPGTMTAVWWESQIDPSIVFGIPQVGCMDMQGNYMENMELQPDILIYNTPEDVIKGLDMQLKVATESLLNNK